MANYAQLSTGSYNDKDTKYAQELLNKYGGYGLAEDGIYGPKTEDSVKQFQRANGLTEDGILGKNTWAKLLQAQSSNTQNQVTSVSTLPDLTPWLYDASQNAAYQQALTGRTAAEQALPTLPGAWDAPVTEAWQQYSNRAPFSYDVSADPLFQQYQELYTRQGQLAMMDTMGQAAALTGGYGSSYAQNAGQQAYQGYLQQLNSMVPEFYGMALDRYNAQGEQLYNAYAMARDLQDAERALYNDQMDNYWTGLNYADNQVQREWENSFNQWNTALQRSLNQRDTNRQQLLELISAGYIPTEQDLLAAGMTSEQARKYAKYYKEREQKSSGDDPGG